MITFDELVESTRVGLSIRKTNPKIVPSEVVRQILQSAGIPDLMQLKAGLESPRRLIVKQIMIQGHKLEPDKGLRTPFVYRRLLGPSFNAWIAGNGTGKSTILKCIVWALTGVEPNIKPDVKPWLDTVSVEIEISEDAVYTIQYRLLQSAPDVVGDIVIGSLDNVPTAKMSRSFSTFLAPKI